MNNKNQKWKSAIKQIKSNNYNKQCHAAELAIFRITRLLVLQHDIACYVPFKASGWLPYYSSQTILEKV